MIDVSSQVSITFSEQAVDRVAQALLRADADSTEEFEFVWQNPVFRASAQEQARTLLREVMVGQDVTLDADGLAATMVSAKDGAQCALMFYWAPPDADLRKIAELAGFETKQLLMLDELPPGHPLVRQYKDNLARPEVVLKYWKPSMPPDWSLARMGINEVNDPFALFVRRRPAARQSLVGGRYRHKKSGKVYRVIAEATGRYNGDSVGGQTRIEGCPFVVYQSETDGKTWVRPKEQFEDGRFEVIAEPSGSSVLDSRRGAMEESLEFYANRDNYEGHAPVTRTTIDDRDGFVFDDGSNARSVLAELQMLE
jgi:hypothetical protein